MKVILLQNLPNLGFADEIKEVVPGYARNFLFPRNLAKLATKKAMIEALLRQKEKEQKDKENVKQAENLAKILEKTIITICVESQKDGKLFGSITEKDISEEIKKQTAKEIEPTNILISHPIKETGEHRVKAKIYKNIIAILKLQVIG
ncbi:MAG: 50S ribosomal protein L9 [Patescibacteria group bacterium]